MLAVFNKTKTTSNGIESWIVVPGMGPNSLTIKIHSESETSVAVEMVPNLECPESDNPIANELIDFIMNPSNNSKYRHRVFTYTSDRALDINNTSAGILNGVVKIDIPYKPTITKTINL